MGCRVRELSLGVGKFNWLARRPLGLPAVCLGVHTGCRSLAVSVVFVSTSWLGSLAVIMAVIVATTSTGMV